jgi:hypothetical protein
VKCPNCGKKLTATGSPAHSNGCVLGALFGVLQDRGHAPKDMAANFDKIDLDVFWEQFGGPAADFLAMQMGLPAYPA